MMATLLENREAGSRYAILKTFEAGIALEGSEVKSLKARRGSLRGAFIAARGREVYLTNATIPPWQPKNLLRKYDPARSRKLLLHRKELNEIIGSLTQRGLTAIPTKVYTKHRKIKLEIALVKPLKRWDQRDRMKKREAEREIARTLKQANL